ncbi:MAG: helix-turn-helix domain-containing protein [Gammaproteobacteria bacterium]|nr:helix-turn-helix domain-containing protein [Gammaproteobacteria bacterium]
MGAAAESSLANVPVFRHACGLCSLQGWCWPPGLQNGDLCRVHAIIRNIGPLPAGTHLFRVDDPFTALYAVRNGCIKSYTLDLQGHEHVRDFHLPGELLGFDAVYPERHHFNALVLKAASLCVIPYRDIAGLSRQIPGLQTRILALMSRDFARQQKCVEGLDATQQFAIFVFDVEARLQRENDVEYEFDLPMSHESIANYLRFSPETISRVISRLQQAGVIQVDREHVRILDVARLGQIADADQKNKSAGD